MTREPRMINRIETANQRMMAGVARMERRIRLNTIGIALCGIMAVAIEIMSTWVRH